MSFQDLEAGRGNGSQRGYANGKQDPTQVVASGNFQINTVVSTFHRLVNTLRTPKDTPELREKLIIKKLESINTIVSSVWWVFGFYWIVIGGQLLLQDSPRLYWLSVVFLAKKKQEVSSTALEGNGICMADLVLQPEDSECCICLFKYVDGAELCTLPCNHHFHYKCVTKWLCINSTCPFCKFNIIRGDTLV